MTKNTATSVTFTDDELAAIDLDAAFNEINPVRYTDHVGEVIAERYHFLGFIFLKNGVDVYDLAKDKETSYFDELLDENYDTIEIQVEDLLTDADDAYTAISWTHGGLEAVYSQIIAWHPGLNVSKFESSGGGSMIPGRAKPTA